MICDLHTHSIHSFDGSEQVRKLCTAAIQRGISVLAITDHAEAMEGVAYGELERDRIRMHQQDIEQAQNEFRGQLEILFGCELGQPHLKPDYAKAILTEFDFDYVIGSLHFFHGNEDLYDVTYTQDNFDQRIRQYFKETMEMIETGGFQCLGHLDYIMRRLQACYPSAPTYHGYEKEISEILSALVERDIALEVNTSGLRKWMGSIGMEEWILRMYRELGGCAVTIGSDAHIAKDLGAGFREACQLIKSAGFSCYTYYRNQEPITVAL